MLLQKLCFLVSCTQGSLPAFSWVHDSVEDKQAVPLLRITFPDGAEDDFAVLRNFNLIPVGRNERAEQVDNCIYDGHLTNEENVYVTVTGGCAGSKTFEVSHF